MVVLDILSDCRFVLTDVRIFIFPFHIHHIAEEPRKENGGELGARPEDGSSGPCWWGGVRSESWDRVTAGGGCNGSQICPRKIVATASDRERSFGEKGSQANRAQLKKRVASNQISSLPDSSLLAKRANYALYRDRDRKRTRPPWG